jgi:hemoglobin/transferrin/lactoferrin receptor protein
MKYLRIATIIFVLLLYFVSASSFAQQRITIYDKETRLPISNVVVFNENGAKIISSNHRGYIKSNKLPESEGLWFQHPAYELYFLPVKERPVEAIYLTPKLYTLDEFVVSAARISEKKKELPYMVQTMKPLSVEYKNSNTAADILSGTGYVSVQKSQGGGGSPILRGFEANRILLVVDGVRMNNAIYRSGHLQNSITIDPSILEKTEILFGPSSVIYGSDALGGVIHYRSKEPVLSYQAKPYTTAEGSMRYSSATNSYRSSASVNAGFRRWASLTNISFSNYGDIIMGKNRPSYIEPKNWGEVLHYYQLINGKDSMIANNNLNKQHYTGYKQYDIFQKITFRRKWFHFLSLNTQYSTSSNISRFDQLNDYKNDHLKFAEYYYGPQDRLLIAAKSNYDKKNSFFNSSTTTVAYQNIKESRHSRRYSTSNTPNDLLNQHEHLNIWSINSDYTKLLARTGKLNYGLELVYNTLKSTASYTNVFTNETSFAPTRYPNGGSFSQSYAVYLSYRKKLLPKLLASSGLRYSYYQYNSVFNKDLFFTPLVKNLINKNSAPSGSFGLVYTPNTTWKINAVFTSGFRVPNIDDYGKIRAKNEQITMPNPDLKPEYAYNAELSATKSFDNEKYIVNINLYYTWLNDAIVREFYQYGGMDSIVYDKEKYRMVTNINAQQAVVKGLSTELIAQPSEIVGLRGTFNYTHGKIVASGEPMGHIPPVFGKIEINYRYKKIKTEAYLHYQGEKQVEDISPYGEDNEEEGTPDGFPAWHTFNIATQYKLNKTITLQASIENIFDQHYKAFASGISAPGRNFIISLSGQF